MPRPTNWGIAYADLGQHKLAMQYYTEAIRLNPQYAEAYNNRGLAHLNVEQYQRAIQDLDEAIRLDSQLALAYANPESTERRLWGQSLKKPEGAPLNLG